jgi:flagellar motility protein MotE (MotC chaperone)
VSSLLEQKAVVLRLEAGSTEAGFLSAFCTIEHVPTFVVIQNGQLQEQLTSGISKDDFINRVRKVLGASPIPGTAQPAAPSQSSPVPAQTSSPAERTPVTTPAPSTSPTSTPSAKAKGKQRATEPESKPKGAPASAAQQEQRNALRKKKQEEKDELARIKARIEADKAGRKAEAEARKAEREKQSQSTPTTSQPLRSTSTRGSQAKDVHLNVRLFDGRTVRSTFPRTAKLQDDVRPWIDQEFAARAEHPGERLPPYLFRQILAPLPSKELSMSDEDQTLGDIDLAPSATLVLIPVKGYTDAYSGGGGGGIVGSATGAVTGLVGGVFGLAGSALGFVGSTVSSVLGGGAGTPQSSQEQSTAGRTVGDSQQQQQDEAGASSVRVRTLADQRAREPRSQQLYNGNQVCLMRQSFVRLC